MKNVHVLPTDKPSRLYLNSENKTFITDVEMKCGNTQHIYITSDEEIKEGCYVIKNGQVFKVDSNNAYSGTLNITLKYAKKYLKKIILTTDQDLIKDGVQAIDDEFLEWFVKNPSCEEVEVTKNPFYEEFNYQYYKIIIPKEEPKQFSMDIELFESHSIVVPAPTNQKTLEEAKLRQLFKSRSNCYADSDDVVQAMDEHCFIETIKEWQQKRMYSEEEVLRIITEFKSYLSFGDEVNEIEWFEQFKKK